MANKELRTLDNATAAIKAAVKVTSGWSTRYPVTSNVSMPACSTWTMESDASSATLVVS